MTAAPSKQNTNKKSKIKKIVDLSSFKGMYDLWDYRVIKRDGVYTIHEVYYNPDGSIYALTEHPVEPLGESPEELKRDLNRFVKAFKQEILEYDKIKFSRDRSKKTGRSK